MSFKYSGNKFRINICILNKMNHLSNKTNKPIKIVFFDTAVHFKINNLKHLQKTFYYDLNYCLKELVKNIKTNVQF